MSDDDDAPVFPMLAFGTGPADGAVVLGLLLALDRQQYQAREGQWVNAAMSADHAIELGRMLIELGERLKVGETLN